MTNGRFRISRHFDSRQLVETQLHDPTTAALKTTEWHNVFDEY